MQAKRWRGWGIDLFLWVCPLAGMWFFVGVLLAGELAPQERPFEATQCYDFPGGGWLAMLGAALLLPLIVSLRTRRLLGFLAAVHLLLLVVAAAGWIRSHWASDTFHWSGVIEAPPKWRERAAALVSSGGGCSLELFRCDDERIVQSIHERFPRGGRRQTLGYTEWSPQPNPPSEGGDFVTTPDVLRRWGFAVAIHPGPEQRVDVYEVPFALALPYWFLCLLALPLPLAWMMRLRRRRRIARRGRLGLCRRCGYDLRATPDAGGARLAICPECGALAQSEQPSARSTG